MKTFKRIWRGARYLEGYGSHPGNGTFIFMIFFCGVAGIGRGGIWGFIGGAVIGAVVWSIPWMVGCYDRACLYERDVERTMERLRKEHQ